MPQLLPNGVSRQRSRGHAQRSLAAVGPPSDVPVTDKSANVKLELRGLLLLSAPVMVQLSAQYAVTVVNQYFIGHQGAGPLAAAAIGNTVSVNMRIVVD